MTNSIILTCCISDISHCTTIDEVFDVLDKYGLDSDSADSVYCCIAASCLNRKEINLLEKQLSAAERALLMKREKSYPKFLKNLFKPWFLTIVPNAIFALIFSFKILRWVRLKKEKFRDRKVVWSSSLNIKNF